MMKFHSPPFLNSKSCVVILNPFGPHHLARCAGSVHTSHTRSRGALTVRVMITSLSCVEGALGMIMKVKDTERDSSRGFPRLLTQDGSKLIKRLVPTLRRHIGHFLRMTFVQQCKLSLPGTGILKRDSHNHLLGPLAGHA